MIKLTDSQGEIKCVNFSNCEKIERGIYAFRFLFQKRNDFSNKKN